MILVDTSVWIDHFQSGNEGLEKLLLAGRVLGHPYVLGEIALGHLRARSQVLGALRDLPQAIVAHDEEVLRTIAHHCLFGIGIGYVDAHLLTAILLTDGARLWTQDKRLAAAAARLRVAIQSS